MPWIRTIELEHAEGLLARIYDSAVKRVGRVYKVLQLQSLWPRLLQASTRVYVEAMQSPDGPLSRAQREMIATTVSRENACFY